MKSQSISVLYTRLLTLFICMRKDLMPCMTLKFQLKQSSSDYKMRYFVTFTDMLTSNGKG